MSYSNKFINILKKCQNSNQHNVSIDCDLKCGDINKPYAYKCGLDSCSTNKSSCKDYRYLKYHQILTQKEESFLEKQQLDWNSIHLLFHCLFSQTIIYIVWYFFIELNRRLCEMSRSEQYKQKRSKYQPERQIQPSFFEKWSFK